MDEVVQRISTGSVALRNDGIVHVIFEFDHRVTEGVVREFLEARSAVGGDAIRPVIVELVRVPYADRRFRKLFMAGVPEASRRAVVAHAFSQQTIFKTFQGLDPHDTPTAFFGSVDEAVAWIHSQPSRWPQGRAGRTNMRRASSTSRRASHPGR
jgi:hypothetical protein